MSTTIREESLEFEFDAGWDPVIKWDDTSWYLKGIRKLQTSGAVDIIAFSGERRTLLMIEVKGFHEHRIENKDKIVQGTVFDVVGTKARDTIAGVCGAARNHPDERSLSRLAGEFAKVPDLRVILWLEEDQAAQALPKKRGRGRAKSRLSVMTQQLKDRLKWLTKRAFVSSRRNDRLSGLGVTVRTCANTAPSG